MIALNICAGNIVNLCLLLYLDFEGVHAVKGASFEQRTWTQCLYIVLRIEGYFRCIYYMTITLFRFTLVVML
jgi:hypothetical protein